MIARIWHGITPAAKAEAYLDFLNQSGVPDYQATPGNRGVYVLRRVEGEVAHFTLISLWDSLEAVKGFAGPKPEVAHYYLEDKDFLLEFEPTVTHHEVVVQP